MKEQNANKIIILTEHFAPAYKAGGIVKSLENLVHGLDDKYIFDIITGNTNLHKKDVLKNVVYNEWTAFAKRSRVVYLSGLEKIFLFLKQSFAIRPHCFYINGMFSFYFTLLPLLIIKIFYPTVTVIIAPRGMLHKGTLRLKAWKKKLYLTCFKICRLHQNIRWHATDKQEQEDIKKMFGKQAKVVLAVPFLSDDLMTLKPIEKNRGHLKLVLISLIAQKKGHLRLIKILKKVQHKLSAELHVYGPVKDEQVWKSCLKEINTLSHSINVVYHGFIHPDDVSACLSQYHFFVLLSSGENFCHAAYESLKAGRPLIISNQTPWRGLAKQKAGWDVPLKDGETLERVLTQAYEMNQSLYNDYCKGAQRVAKRFLKKENFSRQYDFLFR